MFKKILIAIDGGAPARRALEVGVEIAGQLRGVIGALHVIDLSAAIHSEAQGVDAKLLTKMRAEASRLLEEVTARVPGAQALLAEGDPAETIIEKAQEWGADLIVIGTDSRGRLAHFLLGSTADSVIRRAPCPVMAVRVDAVTGQTRASARAAAI